MSTNGSIFGAMLQEFERRLNLYSVLLLLLLVGGIVLLKFIL